MAHQQDEVLSAPMTILGMVNGMIGGLILILPVYALQAGYIITLIVIFITCVFSYYSCYLCIIHMGDQKDLDYAILRHFNGARWAKIFYDLCVWSNLMLLALLYFQLIMIQWQGLIPPHDFSYYNALANALVLFAFIFILKYLQFGASIMAYGIISIICYLLFLIWVVATYNQGNNDVPYKAFGTGAVNLAAAMGQAFSIQSFFMPVLKKNPSPAKYTLYTLIAYIAGGFAYYYIGYMGSVGIWHRTYTQQAGSQKTIQGYFGGGTWEVNIVQAIYLIHLYSVFPEFTLISKRRMFHVLGIKESERGRVTISQIIYFVLVVGVCFVVGILQVDINDIIDINGAVIGFLFIYLIPAVLHIKCLYFSKGKRPMPELSLTDSQEDNAPSSTPAEPSKRVGSQIQFVEAHFDKEEAVKAVQKQQVEQPLLVQVGSVGDKSQDERRESLQSAPSTVSVPESQLDYSCFCCDVSLQTYSRKALIFDWFMIVIMVGLGVFIMINGIYTVAT